MSAGSTAPPPPPPICPVHPARKSGARNYDNEASKSEKRKFTAPIYFPFPSIHFLYSFIPVFTWLNPCTPSLMRSLPCITPQAAGFPSSAAHPPPPLLPACPHTPRPASPPYTYLPYKLHKLITRAANIYLSHTSLLIMVYTRTAAINFSAHESA
jgi:hypothetical protein